ncbi:ABC transporter permease [Nonomuraea zeae]|uniref:ABC transporter permease n=1 Tax=Nonomuraea zeae TaxID=1642303 RepID=A0A5S4HAQ9_9ACTN|nr:ABC transporter permease [Nonomuraea zeae]TMR35960.1 ABC transporter permease [Nonomuraea zeae]
MTRWARAVLSEGTVVAVTLTVVIVAVLLLATGYDPVSVYATMAAGSLTGAGLVSTLQQTVPVVGLTLALCFSFRAGVFNLGGEGQFVIGGCAGAITALTLPGPGLVVIAASLAVAALAAALWAAIPPLLQEHLDAPIFVTSLLLNYPAIAMTSYAVKAWLKDPDSSLMATRRIDGSRRIGPLAAPGSGPGRAIADLFGPDSTLTLVTSGLSWSLPVVAAILAFTIFVNTRLPIGLEAHVLGLNPRLARHTGVNVARVVRVHMLIGGAIAGVVGALVVLSSHYRFIDGGLDGTGYAVTALLVVLLGRSRPWGAVVAGFFFSALIVGGQAMEREYGLSSYLSIIIQALVIFLVTLRLTRAWRTR